MEFLNHRLIRTGRPSLIGFKYSGQIRNRVADRIQRNERICSSSINRGATLLGEAAARYDNEALRKRLTKVRYSVESFMRLQSSHYEIGCLASLRISNRLGGGNSPHSSRS